MGEFDSTTPVVVVGAGPYGLSLAAHLEHRNVEHRIFGKPMHTWQTLLPTMGLKSHDFATNVHVPEKGNRFVEYCRSHGRDLSEPIPFTLFAEYGLWVQRRLVAQVEESQVTRITAASGGFGVRLETGERLFASQVVMATGWAHWESIPPVLAGLPRELVSHTSHHSDYTDFRGKDVTVLGAGSSALEAATLLHERGASVRLLVRGGPPVFGLPPAPRRPLKERLLYPPSVLGPGRKNFLLERLPTAPHLLLSDERRVHLTRTHLPALSAWWLRDRFEGNVDVHLGCEVAGAAEADSALRLTVRRDGQAGWNIQTDHVVCGTGFEVDVDRHTVLDRAVTGPLERIVRAPRLTRHFESSVPGLYFIGAGSTLSFGPLFRFVAGAAYAAPALAGHLARTASRGKTAGARPFSTGFGTRGQGLVEDAVVAFQNR
jgi:FAD-dependent urate hydroxylase